MNDSASRPPPPPDQEAADLESQALVYLRHALGERAPSTLRFERLFAESPLEGEGRTAIFSFDLNLQAATAPGPCDPAARPHFVAVGDTTSNYFPAYRFTPDEAYSFHLGTRFMLTMGVSKVDDALEPPGARAALVALAQRYLPEATIERVELAALFRCEDDYFAVYRARIDGIDYFALGADCPAGFHRLAEDPPQVALRLHLGTVIRGELPAADSA